MVINSHHLQRKIFDTLQILDIPLRLNLTAAQLEKQLHMAAVVMSVASNKLHRRLHIVIILKPLLRHHHRCLQ
jgi:hypothetical protein